MPADDVERRLAAILAADVAGYSRLMEADEAGTLARLKALRREALDPAIADHRGRLVKLMGDGVLVEFASAVDAVRCAVAMQEAVAAHAADKPPERRIALRVGINLGDVIVDGDDVYGDGVNIAARLEALAEPGGICVSDVVHRSVEGRIDATFEDLGPQTVKNMARRVHAFRVVTKPASRPASPVSDRPSIAVLPFTNMSGEAEQDYFVDGITEDIITELSRSPDLFVIARNSVFTYKARAVKVQDVGRDLGVRYVAEGSVRKAGERVRITVQLIDAETGVHIWAERYDRRLVDIFELQDEITQAIVAVLPGRVALAAGERAKRKPPGDMAAYECLLAGRIHHHRLTAEDNAKALELLERAIALEPDFASAWAWKACTLGQAMQFGWMEESSTFPKALEAVNAALALDRNDVECHRLLCEVSFFQHKLDQARLHHETAFALNPNDPRIVAQKGELLTWLGRAEEAVGWIEKALRLDPFDAHKRCPLLGRALFHANRFAEAVEAYKKIPTPGYVHYAHLAACEARLGRDRDAAAHAAEALRLAPDFSTARYLARLPYANEADRDALQAALIAAGLPE